MCWGLIGPIHLLDMGGIECNPPKIGGLGTHFSLFWKPVELELVDLLNIVGFEVGHVRRQALPLG